MGGGGSPELLCSNISAIHRIQCNLGIVHNSVI